MLYHHSEKARGSYVYMCVCVRENGEPDARGRGKYEGVKRGSCGDPASEYGGLVLGADGAPVGFPLVQEPGGAAQGLHVWVHLQGVDLPGGGREEGRKEDVRRVAVKATAPH